MKSIVHRVIVLQFVFCLLCVCQKNASAQVADIVKEFEQQRVALIENMSQSVVAIFAPGGAGGGSGVIVSPDGFVVTNFHVVQGSGGFMPCGLNDGKVYDAVLVGVDPTGDVAVIKLLGRDDFPAATIGNSDELRVGEMSYALGNPFLLATDFQPTVTYGMVSGVHRYQYPAGTFLEYSDCIQVDTSINPGNSGGPLFNKDGELVGINGRIAVEKRGRVNVGAGYAISINQVMNFLDHLKSGRIVDHATLGAIVSSNSDGAVIVKSILSSSAAYRRGLRQGDELISFGGRPVRSVNQFKNVLGIYPKGWTIPLSFQRETERFDVNVQLAALHRRSELINEAPEEPQPEDQPEKPPEDQDKPFEVPNPFHQPPKDEPPAEYAHMFEEKAGYANYYFNKIARERLMKTVSDWGNFKAKPKGWALAGKVTNAAEFQIRFQPDLIASQFAKDFAVQKLDSDFTDVPPGSGGLLAALHQLQQFLSAPEDYFTDFYYLGSEPLDGTGPKTDVIITTRGLVSTRWYFDQQTGTFIGFDTQLEEYVDPCVIRFGELQKIDEIQFPTVLKIQHAGADFAELQIESLKFYEPQQEAQE